jgi:anti-sigma factor RsiW
MDCTGVASHLVAYHLGSIEGEVRDAIDAHLLSCTACLKTYLALKRAADARPSDRPSAEARARLRADVERTFAKPRSGEEKGKESNVVPLFRRRIPLYQGLAFAAVAAAIAFAAPSFFQRFSHENVGDGAPEVDTSRPRAESLQIY